MRTKRPPVNGEVIQAARIRKGMTLEEVQQECAKRGTPVWNLSRMENGGLKWPHPKVIAVLTDVLDLEPGQMLAVAA
jgi:hypothetical protein